MFKANTLFDTTQLIPRPLPEQEKFEEENKHLLTRMIYIMDRAFNMMDETRKGKEKMFINKNWPANEMNGNIWGLVSKEFPQYIKDTGRGCFYLSLGDRYECYIKKLEESLQPQYNHSIKSRQICDQVACVDEPAIPVIFIGYKASKKMQVITGYYAVCVKDDKVLWCTDLTKFLPARGESNPNVDVDDRTVTVTVKQKKKAQ